jgi:hypothetical protein
MRDRSVSRIGLIFAYDPECLPAVILAYDGDGVAEPHDRIIRGLRDHRRRSAARAPITDIAAGAGQGRPITGSLRGSLRRLRCGQRFLDPAKTLRRHVIRKIGDRPVRQILDVLGFLDKRSAHALSNVCGPEPFL